MSKFVPFVPSRRLAIILPMSASSDALLTTNEVAALLKVHPKNIYRLVRRGLPGRRLGGQWRYSEADVRAWVESGSPTSEAEVASELIAAAAAPARSPVAAITSVSMPPSLVAANGDLVVEFLLAVLSETRARLGLHQSDSARARALLAEGAVLAAGSHGHGPPARLGTVRVARIHLVRREIGLVFPRAGKHGRRSVKVADLAGLRLATRPPTAGITSHLNDAAQAAGLDPTRLARRTQAFDSHRDVVCAVLRGEADVGLATRAWAHRVGLGFQRLAVESYGLLVRASDLGDPRLVVLCEVAQTRTFASRLASVPGYDSAGSGDIRYDAEGEGSA